MKNGIKVLITQSFQLNKLSFYKILIKKGAALIFRDNTILIYINLIQSKVAPL